MRHHQRVLLGHTSEQSTKRYTVAIESEAAIQAFKRLKGEGGERGESRE